MPLFLTSRIRGAARHWIIGCLVIIFIIIVVIGSGFYYVSKKVGIGTFDVVAKADPPAYATTDELLPSRAGSFTRTSVTSNSAEIAGMMSTAPANTRMNATSGTVAALYADPSNLSALVFAMNTGEVHRSGSESNPFESIAKSKGDHSQGFHAQSKFKNIQMGMAGWSKPNWTYAVITTETEALDFAKNFDPAK
ncbi:MAG: hypothetical protein ACR2IE_11250 [Candidatus Sumerlaeaceae bacterium]